MNNVSFTVLVVYPVYSRPCCEIHKFSHLPVSSERSEDDFGSKYRECNHCDFHQPKPQGIYQQQKPHRIFCSPYLDVRMFSKAICTTHFSQNNYTLLWAQKESYSTFSQSWAWFLKKGFRCTVERNSTEVNKPECWQPETDNTRVTEIR